MGEHGGMTLERRSFFRELYRRVGEGLGFVAAGAGEEDAVPRRTVEDVKRAMAAAESLKARARRLKLGLSDEDIVALCKAGRR